MTRRPQAERSAATRQLLSDAAIELLIERGWAATTAVAVCERAGVTRGALLHHFPNLSALLAYALESLYEDFVPDRRPTPMTVSDVLDAIWTATSDRRFKAVLEAWSAAGNDPELAQELGPAIGRFSKLVSPNSAGVRSRLRDPEAKALVLTAREAMLGLALGRACSSGRALRHERLVLDRLRAEADAIDARLDRTDEPHGTEVAGTEAPGGTDG